MNSPSGVYEFGAAYPMQRRYQILASFSTTGSFVASARDNYVAYNTARRICETFMATGNNHFGGKSSPPKN